MPEVIPLSQDNGGHMLICIKIPWNHMENQNHIAEIISLVCKRKMSEKGRGALQRSEKTLLFSADWFLCKPCYSWKDEEGDTTYVNISSYFERMML